MTITDDELLAALREALANAEAAVTRYAGAIAALDGFGPTTVPVTVPAVAVERAKRIAPPPATKRTRPTTRCDICGRSFDNQGYTGHRRKCATVGFPDVEHPIKQAPTPAAIAAGPAPTDDGGGGGRPRCECATPGCGQLAATRLELAEHTHKLHNRSLLAPEQRPVTS